MASSGRLKPQEKGKISVSVDVRGKSGNLIKTVKVYTNDPNKAVTTLSVKMSVQKNPRTKQPDHPTGH
jgi:hypothetical protein